MSTLESRGSEKFETCIGFRIHNYELGRSWTIKASLKPAFAFPIFLSYLNTLQCWLSFYSNNYVGMKKKIILKINFARNNTSTSLDVHSKSRFESCKSVPCSYALLILSSQGLKRINNIDNKYK